MESLPPMTGCDTAVVPVAGYGTRLLPITRLVAKEFLPLGRKPAIVRVIEELRYAGVSRIVFVVSPAKSALTDSLSGDRQPESGIDKPLKTDDLCFPGMQFQFVIQDQQLGLGHAIWCARNEISDRSHFVVALGDCVIGSPHQDGSDLIARMLQTLQRHGADAVVGFEEVPRSQVSRYGIANPRGPGEIFEIEDLIEKPTTDEAPSNLAICGRYLLPTEIFEELGKLKRGRGNEIQLTDSISGLIHKGCRAYGVCLPEGESRFDVGDLDAYVQAFVQFALADPELLPSVERAISIHQADPIR